MDLHAWITQQVDRTEAAARVPRHPSPHWEYDHMCGEVRDEANAGTVAFVGKDDPAGIHIALHDPAAVLRRCEADRRILARHRLDPDAIWYEAATCQGCGTEGEMAYPRTDNLNDCPELLDLAHAHGITDEILAGLDRPQTPEPKPRAERYANGGILTPPITTADVPAALRGPRWKP
jgi:catechol 2,3-dioxygenase-like lactoylglutathione lyase family enzyme